MSDRMAEWYEKYNQQPDDEVRWSNEVERIRHYEVHPIEGFHNDDGGAWECWGPACYRRIQYASHCSRCGRARSSP